MQQEEEMQKKTEAKADTTSGHAPTTASHRPLATDRIYNRFPPLLPSLQVEILPEALALRSLQVEILPAVLALRLISVAIRSAC